MIFFKGMDIFVCYGKLVYVCCEYYECIVKILVMLMGGKVLFLVYIDNVLV